MFKNPIHLVLFLASSTLLPLLAEDYPGYKQVRELGGLIEYRLESNGLTVLLLEEHSAPVATFMVTYLVGSRNEVTGTTGSTHLLEHLMFKGTDKFNKENGTDVFSQLQNVGALINATTWLDRTNYYANLPSDHLELPIEIEADRMRGLRLREEDRRLEMTVVRNEFERGENNPYSSLEKEIFASAFIAHPYHHSTIGWRSDIENVPIEKLREFYETYYWPDNATVSIIGDFDTKTALELVKKHFGQIPAAPNSIPQIYTTEPPQRGPRRVVVKRTGQLGVVAIAHKVPEGSHNDTFTLMVLDFIMDNGKNSRLYRALIDKGLAVNTFNDYMPFRDPGLFIPVAFIAPGITHKQVEEAILDVYENIKRAGVTAAEVDRAINQLSAQTAYARDGSYSIASELNEAIAMGDWTFYVRSIEEVKKVTPEDVQRVVKTYMIEDSSTTGHFIPLPAGGESVGETSVPSSWINERNALFYRHKENLTYNMPGSFVRDESGGKGFQRAVSSPEGSPYKTSRPDTGFADSIVRKTIHGIDVISMKTSVKDVVTLHGSLFAGDFFSPADSLALADLTGYMIDKGTTLQDKFALAEKLESVGAYLSFSVGVHNLGISGKFLKKDLPTVINLLAEQLRQPAFDPEELEKLKKQRVGQLKRSLENTDTLSSRSLSRLAFPPEHPNYLPPLEYLINDIEKVTVDDLKTFYDRHYGPNSMILVAVGDLAPKTLHRAIKSAFTGWKGGVDLPEAPKASAPAPGPETIVYMEDKPSVSVQIGMPSTLKKTDPDYLPVMLGTYIFGGNFSARLMRIIRDEEGLTYHVRSRMQGDIYSDGLWYIYASFAPQLLDNGLLSVRRELTRWHREGVTADELRAKKDTLIGSYKVRLATTGGLAARILSFAQRGYPVTYLDQYPLDIEAVTLESVNANIKKYLDPDKMITVMAGSVPEKKMEPLIDTNNR